jgi:hypothetical protein
MPNPKALHVMENNPSTLAQIAFVTDAEQLRMFIDQAVSDAMDRKAPDFIRKATAKDMLTGTELKELTGWSTRSLQHMRDSKQIPYIKHGRKILYPRQGIEKFFEEHHIIPRDKKKGVKP